MNRTLEAERAKLKSQGLSSQEQELQLRRLQEQLDSRNQQDLDALRRQVESERSQREAALKELEFDYRTRKLSEEDYQELRAVYRVEAAEVLKALDQGSAAPGDLEALIDAEIAAWRSRRTKQEGAIHGTA